MIWNEHSTSRLWISIVRLPAVLLLGGITLNDTPVVPIIVHTGDELILGVVHVDCCNIPWRGYFRIVDQKTKPFSTTDETAATISDDTDTITTELSCHPTVAQQRAVEDYIFQSSTTHSKVITKSPSTPPADLLECMEDERDALKCLIILASDQYQCASSLS